ncbi:MAG: biotin/lipoyl-binding protein [Leptolyngbyaceae cyanobacterium SM2_3_12]|nr:biotin/lipoyl-binding protein [Leptolyngbyaceae cyanobacterium SM2_3_12]
MANLSRMKGERWPGCLLLGALAIASLGCSRPEAAAGPQANAQADSSEQAVVVDIAVATLDDGEGRVYTGTTRPARQVSLRSQAEGRLLTLAGEAGDVVEQGQVLGQLDSALLQTAVGEAQAELAAREFEVAQAEAELADIRTQIEQARVQLQQAANDAERLQALAEQGAISTQAAEQAQTTLRTAEQGLQSTQEQVRTRQQAVAAAQQRVAAQQAIVRESQQRLAYGTLVAPPQRNGAGTPAGAGGFNSAGGGGIDPGGSGQHSCGDCRHRQQSAHLYPGPKPDAPD